MGRPHVDPEVPECCQLETSMPRKRALAGVAVAKDPTSASANDAQTNANVATTTRKNLGLHGDEALSQFEVTGMICKGAMRKIRDSTEHQFYGHRLHPYLHPELRRETGMNTLCSTGTSRVQRRSDRRS